MDKELYEYRKLIISAEQKAQEDFDKNVLVLSGGALGISFAFVSDIVGDEPLIYAWTLLAAWITWGASVTCILVSFYFSQKALRKTILQIDNDQIYQQVPGGFYSRITSILNLIGGFLFMVGVIFVVIFAFYNLG